MEWFYKLLTSLLNRHFKSMDQEKRVEFKVRHNVTLTLTDRIVILHSQQKVKEGKMRLSDYVKQYGIFEVDTVFQPLIKIGANQPKEKTHIFDTSNLKRP